MQQPEISIHPLIGRLRYIEENKDDILELLGILGAFFVMWWITVAIEADKIFKAILIMVIGYSIVMLYEKCIHE